MSKPSHRNAAPDIISPHEFDYYISLGERLRAEETARLLAVPFNKLGAVFARPRSR